MLGSHALLRRLGIAAVSLLVTLQPLAASAQDLPSYARGATVSTDETIHGRIRSVDGAFTITVDDDRGFVDTVTLHQGTIINPTGLTLSAGMSVTILGANAGSAFSANEIDTPYSYSGPLPAPVYYGPGYWCPGFGYGYGPSFSLAIVIGGGYGGWSFEHRPFNGRPWDGHGYFGASVGTNSPSRGRVEVNRSFSSPSMRGATGVRTSAHPAAHVPAAFAGRTFAGESRTAAPVASNVRHTEFGGESGRMPSSAVRNSYTQGRESADWRSTISTERAPAPSSVYAGGGSPGGFNRGGPPASFSRGGSAATVGSSHGGAFGGGGMVRATQPSHAGSHGH